MAENSTAQLLHETPEQEIDALRETLVDAVNHLRHHGCLDLKDRLGSWSVYVKALGTDAMEQLRIGNWQAVDPR